MVAIKSGQNSYTVRGGDNLSSIVSAYNKANGTNLTVDDVAEFNSKTNPDLIGIKEVIRFPNNAKTATRGPAVLTRPARTQGVRARPNYRQTYKTGEYVLIRDLELPRNKPKDPRQKIGQAYGQVVGFNPKTGKYSVQFDEGDVPLYQWRKAWTFDCTEDNEPPRHYPAGWKKRGTHHIRWAKVMDVDLTRLHRPKYKEGEVIRSIPLQAWKVGAPFYVPNRWTVRVDATVKKINVDGTYEVEVNPDQNVRAHYWGKLTWEFTPDEVNLKLSYDEYNVLRSARRANS